MRGPPSLALLVLASIACDPLEVFDRLPTDAVRAVSSQLNESKLQGLVLRAHGNPWGSGLMVLGVKPAETAGEIGIWFYYPDLSWSFPARPKRAPLYAVNVEAAKLTPGIPLLEEASPEVRGPAGLEGVSQEEVRSTAVRAVETGRLLYEVRERPARAAGVSPR
jgi:hypothetical protein